MWGSLSCEWCGREVGIETWVSVSARGGHANDNVASRATGLGGGFRPAAGGVLPVVAYGETLGANPKSGPGACTPVSNPLGRPPKSAGRGGRGGAPGRAATTVSVSAPNGLNQPSWRTHRPRLTASSTPPAQPPRRNPRRKPQNAPAEIAPNQPIVGVKTRRNINPVSVSFPKPCAVAAQRTPNTKTPATPATTTPPDCTLSKP